MIKGITIACLFICINLGLYAQPQTFLTANNTNTSVFANGNLFDGGLEIPKASGKKTIAACRFWIAGKNNGNLHVAAELNNNQHDFWAGPLDTSTIQAADSSSWNVIHKITKQEITAHRSNYNKQGYVMPNGIEFWPGSSPQDKGYAKVLAPFVDFNTNKKYEPELGEYPFIRGDEAAYFIANDNANTHFASGGLPMGVEVHGMVYQFANEPAVEHTVFLQLSFINRSQNNYDSVYAGIWSDFLLGDPDDNYISTYPAKNAYLVYNSDSMDGTANGYGVNPPSQAVVFLSHSLDQTMEIAMDNSPRGIPTLPQEFFNYLKHTWRDDKPLTSGSNGYQSLLPTNHIFNGDPCSLSDWTEIGAALPGGKRTMLGSIGPTSLPAKGFLRMDIAFVWDRGNNKQLSSVCELNDAIDEVTDFYRKTILSERKVDYSNDFNAYPNPASNNVTVALNASPTSNTTIEIVDVRGKTVLSTLTNSSETVLNTSTLANGIYYLKVSSNNSWGIKKLLISR